MVRPMKRLSRRHFLALTGGAGAALLAGCEATSNSQSSPTATGTRTFVPNTASDGVAPTATTTTPAGPTIAEMAGGILLMGFRGLELADTNPIVADIRDRNLGGVILFSYDVAAQSPIRNVQSPQQVAALTANLRSAAGRPLLIATDQEGGLVARLGPANGFPATPSHQALGQGTPAETRTAAAAMAGTLKAAGINWNLAPVLDVNVNPENPIVGAIERSFSADPAVVAEHAAAYVQGMHDQGILASAKHFPGHGSSVDDSHEGFVDITGTWSDFELDPYRTLAPQGLLDSVLVAHVFNANLDPVYPASLSSGVIEGLLRGEIGFDGPVVSDDMQMGAITQHYGFRDAIRLALLAGNDILVFGNNLEAFDPDLGAKAHAEIVDLVQAGDVPEERLAEAFARAQSLRDRLM